MWLADQGAEVIKIEPRRGRDNGESQWFHAYHN